MTIAVVGDLLLDHDLAGEATRLSPDAPVPVVDVEDSTYRAGGAGLVARMLAADGHDVVLIGVTGSDAAAGRLRAALDGIRLVAGPSGAPTPVKTRIRASGQAVVRVDEGCARPGVPGATPGMLEAIASADAVVVADYGRRLLENDDVRAALEAAAAKVPVVWDPHPSGAPPVRGLAAATPNHAEALAFGASGDPRGNAASDSAGNAAGNSAGNAAGNAARAATVLAGRWGCPVVVTLGRQGALLHHGSGSGQRVPAPAIGTMDPCGAGDRFVASLAVALAAGADLHQATQDAVQGAARFLADGGVSALHRHFPIVTDAGPATTAVRQDAHHASSASTAALETTETTGTGSTGTGRTDVTSTSGAVDVWEVLAQVRAAGGTVVATGGCFDLIHAGHARTLQAARALGDCLVVLLNSDDSVRRLKGADRPIISAHDRAELLTALGCVDAVLLFEEDTPLDALDRVRPDIWVKGGDYAADELPETPLIASWGGRSVIVPYHVARSTTSLAAALAKVG